MKRNQGTSEEAHKLPREGPLEQNFRWSLPYGLSWEEDRPVEQRLELEGANLMDDQRPPTIHQTSPLRPTQEYH
jgi:hypothetical protein